MKIIRWTFGNEMFSQFMLLAPTSITRRLSQWLYRSFRFDICSDKTQSLVALHRRNNRVHKWKRDHLNLGKADRLMVVGDLFNKAYLKVCSCCNDSTYGGTFPSWS